MEFVTYFNLKWRIQFEVPAYYYLCIGYRPPEEIAALLSCMVFQQRNCSAPELTPSLEKGKAEIEKCAGMITRLQTEAHMKVPDFVDQVSKIYSCLSSLFARYACSST